MWAKSQGKLEPAILLARKEHEERSGASRSATSAEDIVNHNLVASDEETERSSRTSPPGDADDTIDDHDKVTSSDANSAKAHTSKPVVRSPHKRTAPEITTRSSASRAAIVGTMKTSPSKKHEKPTETARLVRQDLNQSEAEKTTNRSPARLRLIMKSHDRATAMARLKAQGVEFESSEEEDYEDEIPQFGNPAPSKLWQTATQPKAIDPLLNYKHTRAKITWPTSTTTSQNETLSQSTHNLKLTKRQGLKNRLLLRQHQMFRNLYLTGNAHHEVNREQSQALLRATVQRKVPHDNASRDKLAPDSIMTKEEIMSFQEFLGVPQDVELEPCLFGPTQGLAFREKGDDAFGIGLGGGYVGMRNRRRVLEGEKWPVSER
ncbi:hypothetical protein H2198_008238 [Neophaeococcomyces mojaviensis]|uniref:Uncharacterized protein n=1 Tax=Neophaeococcomyces mojaviensis TaxID=3383035 RepID=A0ACC2ZY78_9EURO|nr:hypothetical protein H2198_008238 [Knufia sp. JES_112]